MTRSPPRPPRLPRAPVRFGASEAGPQARIWTTRRRAEARPGSLGRTSRRRRVCRDASRGVRRHEACSCTFEIFESVFPRETSGETRDSSAVGFLARAQCSEESGAPVACRPCSGERNSTARNLGIEVWGAHSRPRPGPGRGQAFSMTSSVVLAEATKTDVDSAPVSEVRRDPRNTRGPGVTQAPPTRTFAPAAASFVSGAERQRRAARARRGPKPGSRRGRSDRAAIETAHRAQDGSKQRLTPRPTASLVPRRFRAKRRRAHASPRRTKRERKNTTPGGQVSPSRGGDHAPHPCARTRSARDHRRPPGCSRPSPHRVGKDARVPAPSGARA